MQPLVAIRPGAQAGGPPPARPPRHDPAPSRVAYRLQRVWLTPFYRRVLRLGVPAFLLIAATGAYFANAENRAVLAQKYHDIRRSVETRPEFMVKLMSVEGASPLVDTAIRERVAASFPISSFDLDLDRIKTEIAALDVVRAVDVRIRPGGVLAVHIAERQPALVWRAPEGIELIDVTGHRVASLTARSARPDLPLVAGAGADARVDEALALFAAARPLADRLRGLVRVGERRWDVVLDGDKTILLPEDEPVRALEQVLALDQAQDLLARDLVEVDMRNPQRPTIRLTQLAITELRHIRSLSLE